MKFHEGDIYWILRGPGKPYKIHITAIIDMNMIVFKWYGRHKQWWHYEIVQKSILESEIKLAKRTNTNNIKRSIKCLINQMVVAMNMYS